MSSKLLSRTIAAASKLDPKLSFDINSYLFDKQLNFVKDPARFKVATCSRRAGKTISCAADLIDTCQSYKGITCLYLTLNRLSAKRIIWRQILEIIREYKIPVKINESELTIEFQNTKSILYISGAKDGSEIEKFRGLALKKVYIDESQAFRSYIKELIEDVLAPALYDYNGHLILIGTPGPVLAGPFYEAFHDVGGMRGYSKHHWSILDNPHIKLKSGKEPAAILAEELKRRGLDTSDPTYLRESLGLWVEDTNALVYKFQSDRGFYDKLPDNHAWEYIVAADVGFEDADAIAVLAFSQSLPTVYLVEEYIRAKSSIETFAAELVRLRDKYNPIAMVGDYGGLGKKIFESVNERYHLVVKPAEKARKFEYISLINDDLRTQRLLVPKGCAVAEDWMKIQWHPNQQPGKPKIDDAFHSDIADAVLYGWREAKHYTYVPPEVKPTAGTKEYFDMVERQMLESVLEQRNKEKEAEEGIQDIDLDDFDMWGD